MSRFDDIQPLSSKALFALHGESVWYRPKGGEQVQVTAIVSRLELVSQGPEQWPAFPVEIAVRRIDVPIVTKGSDRVTLYRRKGDSQSVDYTVAEVMSQDGDSWLLGLR